MNDMEKVFLIDGHAQIFRMYYAFLSHPLINSKGENTSILYGFTKMLLELIHKEHPTHMAVVFDSHEKTFRHLVYKGYKAQRPPAPELVINALEPLKEILAALNIRTVVVGGVEADDVIGSMSVQWRNSHRDIYMVTPDKDYGQLIAPNVYQYKFPKNGGVAPEVVGVQEICGYYGIKSPKEIVDILAIWGDASDNVPGVKGIGEIGAKNLVGVYGSVDNILRQIEKLPKKLQDKILASKESLELSKFLVTIKTDVELPLKEEDAKMVAPNESALDAVFAKYEIRSLKKALSHEYEAAPAIEDLPADDMPSDTLVEAFVEGDVKAVADAVRGGGEMSVSLTSDNELIVAAPQDIVYHGVINDDLISLLTDSKISKTGFNLKEIYKYLFKGHGVKMAGELYDIALLHYILDPEKSHSAAFIAQEVLEVDINALTPEDASSAVATDLFSQLDESAKKRALQREMKITAMFRHMRENLLKKSGDKLCLYTNMEMPLITTLANMELTGVKIDTAQLSDLGRELSLQMLQIEREAKALANAPSINLSSPKQVGLLLFEKLRLDDKVKKSSSGSYPTDEQTLSSIAKSHPIVGKILEYRAVKKLLSTYIEVLPNIMDRDSHKVHTTFNQALTSTGRLSSINPNLQNIPVRTERGREIRKAFIASDPEGYIVSADYSQIELRLMAHLSGDEALIKAFHSGADIHAATAAKLFGVDIEAVTDDQRRRAKTVNFGIIYGISPFGLSERLGIDLHEAKAFIETYFKTYSGVNNYITTAIELARKRGYVETIYGRRRYLREINSRNANVRKFNERNAINAPLQGSAADIIKAAMVNIAKRLNSEGVKSKMVLQVHDELIFDVAPDEKDTIMKIAKEEMESVIKLKVPLITDCGYGKNWLEAH